MDGKVRFFYSDECRVLIASVKRVSIRLLYSAVLHSHHRASRVGNEDLLLSCGFLFCRGLVSRVDLISAHLHSSPCLFCFSLWHWSFVAGVNIESEKYLHWSCLFHCWHTGATGFSAGLQRQAGLLAGCR